ncbi:MAG TPA: cellulase family glycosylhydrolase [Pilimelia sp.]|nr:cellulase family glycosylhydrolase [Pilimelia sp.]
MNRRLAGAVVALAGLLAVAGATPALAQEQGSTGGFVTRHGATLKLDGQKFRFGGTNNYYLMYKSRTMVDDVFADAKAAGFPVMRTWGFIDIGNADGTNSVAGIQDGVYFQYWDGTKPAYNDGENGLQRLDYVLAAAKAAGVKLVIPLTNNWRDFGGMDQYVRWRGGQYHDDFYTDEVIKGWYKDWIAHVLNRTNSITGVRYADDPTVMTWELGNEPRCKGSGVYPPSPTCSTDVLTSWADEMSRYIKSLDRKHLVSVGDEGFFCDDPASTDWTLNCGEGVDTVRFAALPAIDVMSYHLYPDAWGKDAAWGTDWIRRHSAEAKRIGKPVMLGEFGQHDKAVRNTVYKEWTDAVISSGGTGFLYWILSGIQDDGTLYPDYDGHTVYCPSPVCTNLSNAASEIRYGQRSRPPVADHDTAVVEFGQSATVAPVANDIAYRTRVRAGSVDLDPATAGQQRTATVAAGTFTVTAAGALTFVPVAGFVGRATVSYTVRDLAGRLSNVATVTVTVKPDPAGALTLASFEEDTQGWAPASWQTNAGTVAQSTEYATAGTHSLRVNAADGGWFGVTLAEPLDLSTRVSLKYDLRTDAAMGTNVAVAVQTGSALTWCQSTFTWVSQNSTYAADIDLLSAMSCDSAALADARAVFVYFNSGAHTIDNVRVE